MPPPNPTTGFIAAPWYHPPVASVLMTPPTAEPLTLAEAKLRAGLDWPAGDPRDALMEAFISAARAKVEVDTGLALLTQTRAITFSADWAQAADSGIVPLPMHALPLQSLTDPDGVPVPQSRYRDGFAQRRNVLQLAVTDPVGTWTIVSGWENPGVLLKEAPLLVQAVGLLVAHFATAGRDLAIVGTIVSQTPLGYEACIEAYRLVTLA